MDTSIRRITPAASVTPVPNAARATLSLPYRAPLMTEAEQLDRIRKAIVRCAAEALKAEPRDTDARLHSFLAKLSGSMEGLAERELDIVLWNLLCTSPVGPAGRPTDTALLAAGATFVDGTTLIVGGGQ